MEIASWASPMGRLFPGDWIPCPSRGTDPNPAAIVMGVHSSSVQTNWSMQSGERAHLDLGLAFHDLRQIVCGLKLVPGERAATEYLAQPHRHFC